MRKYLKVFCHKRWKTRSEKVSTTLHPYLRLTRVMSFYLIAAATHTHPQTRGFLAHSCTDRCANVNHRGTHKTMNSGADSKAAAGWSFLLRWLIITNDDAALSSVRSVYTRKKCSLPSDTLFSKRTLWNGVEVAIAMCVKKTVLCISLCARGAFVCFAATESRVCRRVGRRN